MQLAHEANEFGDSVGLELNLGESPRRPEESEVLIGRSCRLEALDANRHAAELWDAFSLDTDGRLWTYMPQGPFTAAADYRTWVEKVQHQADPFFYAIIDLETGLAVGVASYLRIDPVARSIEVGWITFSPLIQRKVIATEAMYLMMRHAFALGYRRYEWKCNALNAPSISAAMRLGMSFEGLFRQATVVKGRNRDTAWFAILDQDWPMAEAAFQTWLDPDNFDSAGNQRQRLSDLTAPLLTDRWPTLTVKL